MSSLKALKDILPWTEETAEMMIEEFGLHTKNLIPCLSKVKKLEHQPGASLINLKWCGMQCSGKYGHFLKSGNQCAKKLDNYNQSSVNQGSSCLSSNAIYKSAVTNPNAEAYSIDQLKQILKGSENEVTLLSEMRHENIITLLGVVYSDRSGNALLPMLVMESVQCDLHDYLQSTESTSWSEDLMILEGISCGLVYLHEVKSVIHNYITTRTILLTKNLVVKLSNFESAVKIKIHDSCNTSIFSNSSDIVLFGNVILNILCLKYHDTHTEDDESFKQLMVSLHKKCTSTPLECRPTAGYILNALNEHKSRPVQKTQVEMLDELKKLVEENQKLQQKLTAMIQEKEESHFLLTNSFTKVDSRSPTSLSEEYKFIQHRNRLSAARAHRKAQAGCDPVPFQQHTMIAFGKAKQLAFTAFNQYLEQSIFQLHKGDRVNDASDNKTLSIFRLMLKKFYEEHNLTENPTETIRKALDKAYEGHVGTEDAVIPEQVKEYYKKLSIFTWSSVTKPIPMVPSMEENTFDDDIHELKDDVEDDDNKQLLPSKISYIYPTLFVSNGCSRQVAVKGKVQITSFLPSTEQHN